jgi:predicted nucleic acid-binding Zn ribbon protein
MPKQKHRVCQHANAQIKMKRLYARQGARFMPNGWYCPDCKQMVKD